MPATSLLPSRYPGGGAACGDRGRSRARSVEPGALWRGQRARSGPGAAGGGGVGGRASPFFLLGFEPPSPPALLSLPLSAGDAGGALPALEAAQCHPAGPGPQGKEEQRGCTLFFPQSVFLCSQKEMLGCGCGVLGLVSLAAAGASKCFCLVWLPGTRSPLCPPTLGGSALWAVRRDPPGSPTPLHLIPSVSWDFTESICLQTCVSPASPQP